MVSFNEGAVRFENHSRALEKKIGELYSELKEKNEALEINFKEKEEVKDYLHSILESLNTGVVVFDPRGKISTFNRSAGRITGLDPKEVRGKSYKQVFGSAFLHQGGRNLKSLRNIHENSEYETELCKGNKNVSSVNVSACPVRGSQGKKIGIVLTLQDITRLKKLEERANRTDRLAAMGEMAVRIAHDIRNPLGSIALFAGMLKRDLEESHELRQLAEHIVSGVKSINSIISNLLLFIKPQQRPDFHIIDLHDPLNDSQFFSSHFLKSSDEIKLITKYFKRPLMIKSDVELLKQMILNLILNAIQAMPKGGKLTISTNKLNGNAEKPSLAEIKFADTGIGIPKEKIHKIFDPFFTTKNQGTGLGLAIVHNIIKLHGGSIDVCSEEGEGTIFTITFPLFEEKKGKTGGQNASD